MSNIPIGGFAASWPASSCSCPYGQKKRLISTGRFRVDARIVQLFSIVSGSRATMPLVLLRAGRLDGSSIDPAQVSEEYTSFVCSS